MTTCKEVTKTLDHEDGVPGPGQHQIEHTALLVLDAGVDQEHVLSGDVADPDACHGLLKGDVCPCKEDRTSMSTSKKTPSLL